MVLFKREKVLNVFRKGKFKLLTLTETKLKGNGDLLGCLVNGIIAGVQELKELGEVWPSC